MKRVLLCILLSLSLASCETVGLSSPQYACPETGVLSHADAAALFARPLAKGAPVHPAADVAVYAGFNRIRSNCAKTKDGGREIDLALDVAAEKTELGQSVTQEKLTYFVSVIDDAEAVLQRSLFYVTLDFGNNDSVQETLEHRLVIPASQVATARIVVGFTLTPEQEAFNKAHPHDFGTTKAPDR